MKQFTFLSLVPLLAGFILFWLLAEHYGCIKARLLPTYLEYGREARAFQENPNSLNCQRYLNARLNYLRSVDCCPENILYMDREEYEEMIERMEGLRGGCI